MSNNYLVVEGALEVIKRTKIRSKTAYPFLRQLLSAWIILYAVIVAIAEAVVLFSEIDPEMKAAIFVGMALSFIFPWAMALLAQAMLDIADCWVSRTED